MPKYGEYAPAGSVPAYGAPVTPPNPYGVPTYGAAAPATPAAVAPTAPVAPEYAVPQYGAPVYAPAVRTRRTWDTVLTIILLVLGLLGTFIGVAYAAIFANPAVLSQAMASQGITGFSVNAGSAPLILVISHVALFLVALGLSIAMLIRGRIVVFWIPLAAGVVAAIIFWVTVFSVLTSDPSFLQHYGA